jgi:hypothetical protein
MELYFYSPNTPSWRGAQLKAWGQLIAVSPVIFVYSLVFVIPSIYVHAAPNGKF